MEYSGPITAEEAVTLDGLFRQRVHRTPDGLAYRAFDARHRVWRDYTWGHMAHQVARWQAALEGEGLRPGDRVAVMVRNSPEWVVFDQAALGLGLVTVPLYTADRPENAAYVLQDAGAKLLLVETAEQWQALVGAGETLDGLCKVVSLEAAPSGDTLLRRVEEWLPDQGGELRAGPGDDGRLATIIYTSGTTGRPKGVMLSHGNILSNAAAALKTLDVFPEDVFLSFLPLSHAFERTAGYYLPILSGSTVAYARSIPELGEDLLTIRPTILISVPRIYERVHGAIRESLAQGPALRRALFEFTVAVGWDRFLHAQGRGPWRLSHGFWPLLQAWVARKVLARLGGRLRVALSGGAALPVEVSRLFIALGLPLLQGYGLSEAGPVVSANRLEDNVPESVGRPLEGVEVRIGEGGALLVRGPNVMQGYWNNPQATAAMFTADGWLNTGDTARLDEVGRITITGRIKDILVLSNGEKVPPADMEAAIVRDPLFQQVMVIGDGRPYLTVLAVLDPVRWRALASAAGLDPDAPAALTSKAAEKLALERIAEQIREFPGYAQVRRAGLLLEPWSIENGLLTPTLKMRRAPVLERHREIVAALYRGH